MHHAPVHTKTYKIVYVYIVHIDYRHKNSQQHNTLLAMHTDFPLLHYDDTKGVINHTVISNEFVHILFCME